MANVVLLNGKKYDKLVVCDCYDETKEKVLCKYFTVKEIMEEGWRLFQLSEKEAIRRKTSIWWFCPDCSDKLKSLSTGTKINRLVSLSALPVYPCKSLIDR